jgi:hypothetical protein
MPSSLPAARVPPIGWSEIDPALLDDGRGIVPAFPLDLLPSPWRGWVADTAASAGAPVDYVAQAVLAGVAGLCGAGAVVQVTPSWREPLVLWQALIGRASSGKSPALASMRGLLATLEEARGGSEGDGDDKSGLLVTDGAVEAAARAAAHPRGALLWRDAPSGRLSLFDGEKGGDRSRWLEASTAGPVAVSDARPASRRCPLSVLVSIRPDRLVEALRKGDDGLAARFLYAWPDAPGWRPLAERRSAHDEQALDLLRHIACVARPPADPLVLALDPSAAKAFDGFLAKLHARQRQAEGLEADWLGKGGSTVARLAGVLELLAWSGLRRADGAASQSIGAKAVEAAVALWSDYFSIHARLVFDRAGPTDTDRYARRVVRWLKVNRRTEITREDVRRHALCRAVDASATDTVLTRLFDAHVVRPLPRIISPQAGRPAQRWEVNPGLMAV